MQNPRQILAAFRDELKKTPDDMESKGVIKKVDQPTNWVNSLVISEKKQKQGNFVCIKIPEI